jgi:quinol monooxygenase YgiN
MTALLFLIPLVLTTQTASANGGRLFGAWQLREFVTISADKREKPFCASPSGTLIYESGGSMSVGINCPDGHILFYSGSFKVRGTTVIHQLANASDPALIGHELVRTVDALRENELVLSGPLGGSQDSIRIIWTRTPTVKEATQESLALLSYLKVKPGFEDRFRKEISTIVEASRSEPGNIAWFVQEQKDDPTQFVFYTRWVDDAALTHHLQSPPLASYLKRTAPFLAEPAKLVRFTPVDN